MVNLIVLLVVILAMAGSHAASPAIHFTTEHSPPMSMQQGTRVIGSATDKVRELMTRTGISYSIELLPWSRAYAAARKGPNTCVFSTTRTPEREALFKWVGPTEKGEWVLLARADRKLALNSLEQARHLRIGTYFGDARDIYLRTRGFTVDPAQNDLVNPPKLMLGRIDLWAAGIRQGSSLIERSGYAGKIVPALVFNRVEVYIACNLAMDDTLIEKMQATLESMINDGSARRIDARYDNWIPPSGPGPK